MGQLGRRALLVSWEGGAYDERACVAPPVSAKQRLSAGVS
jgi:hypothetical protein